jgi:hypothetical protein
MTTLDAPPLAATARRDTRTLRRAVAAVLLPLGTLSIAAIRGVLPYSTADDYPAILAGVATDPGAMRLVLWMTVLALFTLLPSMLAAVRVALRGAPVLATIALGLLVPAFVGLMLGVNDDLLYVAATGGYDQATMVRLLTDVESTATATVGLLAFVAGHIVGMVLLGIALWRSRAVPAWAGIAVAVSQPLHLMAVLTGAPSLLDAGFWLLAAVGFGAAAIRVLRTANDDWDLPPQRS